MRCLEVKRGGLGQAGIGRGGYGVATRPVWQGVSTDFLKFHPAPLGLTLLRPMGGPPLR
jgi:hypothetical protein